MKTIIRYTILSWEPWCSLSTRAFLQYSCSAAAPWETKIGVRSNIINNSIARY
nr:hypothetical protein [Cressdnaviricota sp.]